MPITIDNESLPESQVFSHGGNHYNRETWVQCFASEQPVRRYHALPDADGNLYHPSVYCDTFGDCRNCSAEINRNDCHTVDGLRYCEDCYDRGTSECPGCGEEVHSAACRRHPSTGEAWHGTCYDECYAVCNNCGRNFEIDCEGRHTDNGWYCDECEYYEEFWSVGDFRPSVNTFDEIKSERKFGVEMETSRCQGHKVLQGEFPIGADEDASVSGVEFVTPVYQGDAALDQLRAFCKRANELNFEVDQHCGLHVHLDVGDLNGRQLVNVCAAYQLTYNVWVCFFPDSRIRNRFCIKNDWNYRDFVGIATADEFMENSYRGNRQQWFNIDSYNRHRTFEVRIHTASLNGRKITNWVKAHTRFIDAVKDMEISELEEMFSGTVQNSFDVISEMWDDMALTKYYAFRSRRWGKPLVATEKVLETVA